MAEARKKIPFKTSVMVRYEHPTNESVEPNEPLDNTDDGSTCSFRVFDHQKEEEVTSDVASGADTIPITNPAAFLVGDTVELEQDDGSIHSTIIDIVSPSAGTVELNAVTTDTVAAGNKIRARLGDPVAMSEYGTPTLGETDWGFEGLLASDHAGLEIDVEVDIEISFVGDPGNPGDLDVLAVICGVIKPKEDCSEH
jgi:hypothetical protein